MNFVLKLFAFFRAAMPLPAKTEEAITKWIVSIAPSLSPVVLAMWNLIVPAAAQLKATGTADIDLGDGSMVTIYQADNGDYCMSDDHKARFCAAAAPGANGKWLSVILDLVPVFLKYLPMFLAVIPAPDPAPAPTPAPTPVV